MDLNTSDHSTHHQSVDSDEKEKNISIPVSGKTLYESLEHAFDNKKCTDVTFLVGKESTPIKSHKLILISRSSVFETMFDGPLAEKGDIKIEDADEEHFKIFLRFLYTDSAVLTAECVEPLVYLAEKYDIGLLKKKCEGFLEEKLQIENACKILEIANTYNMTSLCKLCLNFIGLTSEKCLQSQSFLEVNEETVDLITKSETLKCQEERIFEALDRWTVKECHRKSVEVDDENKKKVIQKYLKNIRFPFMSHQYVSHEVSKRNYLTSDEILGILNSDKTNPSSSLNPRLGFNYDVVVRFENKESELETTEQGGWVNAISFKVSHHSWLYGAHIYGSSTKQTAMVGLRVTNDVGSNIASVTRQVQVGTGVSVHNVFFEAPVCIHAGKEHTLSLGLFVADNAEFYCKPTTSSSNKRKKNQSNPRVTHTADGLNKATLSPKSPTRISVSRSFQYKTVHFYKSSFSSNKSSVHGGQIPGLLLF